MLTTHLSLLTYVICILSILAHYPIGRLFGQRSLLAGAFVGICISAFVVAILANTFASGIRPYIFFSLVILLPSSLWLLWQSKGSYSSTIVFSYFVLL